MVEVRYITIGSEDQGQRLDNFLLKQLKGVPRSHVYRLIRGGEVRVNKKRAKADSRVCCGDSIRIPPVRVSESKAVHVGSRIEKLLQESILYEDETLIVLNKPSGIAVHGGSGLSLGVIEAMRKIRSDLPYLELVHRIDRETSGCLLLAKKRSMLRSIQALFESRQVKKTYWALLNHPWQGKQSIAVDKPLEKNIQRSGERMVRVGEEGKASLTYFKLLKNFKTLCLVEAMPKTGRTHQIRVHSAWLGHPIVGDDKYGKALELGEVKVDKKRLYLHARAIEFTLGDKHYCFEAELDESFENLIKES